MSLGQPKAITRKYYPDVMYNPTGKMVINQKISFINSLIHLSNNLVLSSNEMLIQSKKFIVRR